MAKAPKSPKSRSGKSGSRAGSLPAINPKSGKPYTAAYRRRIERGLAKGKSRQEARGKKAGEYKERAKRETAKYGKTPAERRRRLPPEQRKEIRDFARHRARMRGRGTPRDAFVPDMENYAADKGFDEWEEMAAAIDFSPGSASAAAMWDAIEDFDVPDPAWALYEEKTP